MALNFKCKECGTPLGFDGICFSCRARLHRQEVAAWTAQDIAAKKQQIIADLNQATSKDFYKTNAADILKDLLTLGVDCRDIAKVACERQIYYPSAIYYHAEPYVRDQLIERLKSTDSANEGGLLMSCLALVGDQESQNALYELKLHPKEWRKNLFVDSDIYAQDGGWTFNSQNERIPLIFDACYAFVKPQSDANSSPPDATPKIVQGKGAIIGHQRKHAEKCPHCGCDIVDMLVIDGRDPRFKFLGINGLITASCCPNCVSADSEGISCRFNLEGGSELLDFAGTDENYCGEYFVQGIVENDLVLTDQPVSLFYGVFNDYICTIGGFALWWQDYEYRECPVCGKTMKYLAQIPWDTFDSYMEGSLYFEICPDCQVITMFHQQT